jgi:DNA-binding NtrC family response regulator
MAAMLEQAGYRIMGPVATMDEALACLQRERPEAAVLDITLAGASSAPLAKALAARGVPFVLATDHPCPAMLDAAFEGAPRLGRPFLPASLAECLREAVSWGGGAQSGKAELRREGLEPPHRTEP